MRVAGTWSGVEGLEGRSSAPDLPVALCGERTDQGCSAPGVRHFRGLRRPDPGKRQKVTVGHVNGASTRQAAAALRRLASARGRGMRRWCRRRCCKDGGRRTGVRLRPAPARVRRGGVRR